MLGDDSESNDTVLEREPGRPRISRLSSLFPVADAMLAAAHSDRPASDVERTTIRRLLCELLSVNDLPERLELRLQSFEPGKLDLKSLADELAQRPVVGRCSLIELARQVCDSDADLDLSEDRFLLALALALSLEPEEIGHVVYASPFRGLNRLVKRSQDLLLGLLLLAACALPMLAIAFVIKRGSPGPVLFRQRRHGEDGVEFEVFKFRSMTTLENGADVVQARRGDARITPEGAFLRRTSLDELPQLLNVIAGHMSLVGPRPHAVAHNALYRTKILEYMRRHHVKPGITGWAQVNGLRGETDTLDKMVARVEHDLAYIRGWSLWLDIKILFLTIFGRKVRQNAY
ncbi:MAG TPA: exopolysaccharide biosynthesis polyprenyl glycosylphosphotransferase [Polyangiales bacterium]|nr:exopolysaccharide biosynthesis polyprenyl glycosylphosphotransferase [Polyangiales bacterium]